VVVVVVAVVEVEVVGSKLNLVHFSLKIDQLLTSDDKNFNDFPGNQPTVYAFRTAQFCVMDCNCCFLDCTKWLDYTLRICPVCLWNISNKQLLLPRKRCFRPSISARIQPTDHISIAAV